MNVPPQLHRSVLDRDPVADLADHRARGGGTGLGAAQRLAPAELVEEVEAAGLRGRGGAGFPTGQKWRTVAEHTAGAAPPKVVVNAAEGEPGSFKDRALLRANPYKVLEGAVIAARAVGAREVVVALSSSAERERERLETAIAEVVDAGWFTGLLEVATGPAQYLFGEETALLEVLAGRPPFPRIAPPFRHGLDADAGSGSATMATDSEATGAAPVLVNNVETLAHVPHVLAHGPDAYRRVGTADSPGTLLCTVSGRVRRASVGEVPMGTPLADVVQTLGGGARPGRQITGVLPGVSGPVLTAAQLDTPVSHAGFEAAGSSLGAGAFIVLDDSTDPVEVAAEVARFLAVESCGQCRPCKEDGLAVAGWLDDLLDGRGTDETPVRIRGALGTVTDGARCFLAHQTQLVVGSLLDRLGELDGTAPPAGDRASDPLVAPIADLVDGRVAHDPEAATRNPDWSHGAEDSGATPAERLDRPPPTP